MDNPVRVELGQIVHFSQLIARGKGGPAEFTPAPPGELRRCWRS